MKRLIIDLDDTICVSTNGNYAAAIPKQRIAEKLADYKANGFTIVLHTSRNMRSYDGNIGLITARTVPKIIEWLEKNKIPYDEIYIGKPWCGTEGFYVDDRAVRPSEFLNYSYSDIMDMLENSR